MNFVTLGRTKMKKDLVAGMICSSAGLILTFASLKVLPDVRPILLSLAIFIGGIVIVVVCLTGRQWNRYLITGGIIAPAGIVLSGGALGFLPDIAPVATTMVIASIGGAILVFGMIHSEKQIDILSPAPWTLLSWGVVIGLCMISLALLTQISFSRPGDPAAVMILSALTAAGVLYAILKDHPARRQIVVAGGIAIINFCLIPLYEGGYLNFIGQFYLLFVPFYSSFDPFATTFEYSLIALTAVLTVILVGLFTIRKTRVAEFGSITLVYLILQPALAIFLFEMVGNPAGFLAGATTRSDLLVTDTNAVMSTFGMVFIAVMFYIGFELLPLWVPPTLAGLWWVLWKPFFLHHPDPALFSTFGSFLPAATFLFLTGFKRVGLPMVLIILILILSGRGIGLRGMTGKGE